MIHATLSRDGKVGATREYADVEALMAFLRAEMDAGGEVVIRVPDDETFMRLDLAVGQTFVEAQRRAQLVAGARATFWGAHSPVALLPTSNGWVVRLAGRTVTAEAPRVADALNGQAARRGQRLG